MRTDLRLILEAIDSVQTELYRANQSNDVVAIADASQRLTTLIACLDIQALLNDDRKAA